MTSVLGFESPLPALSVQDRLVLKLARRSTDCAMHLGLVMLLAGRAPNLDQLTAHLHSRLGTTPELTCRVSGPPRHPRWEPDPSFDIRHHVHKHVLSQGEANNADHVLNAMLDQPLAADQPRWGVWLIHGTNGYALCYKAHHAFQDGTATSMTIDQLFGPPTSPVADHHHVRQAHELRPVAWNAAVLKDLLPPLRRTARWSALDTPLTGQRTAGTASIELSRLHTIGRASGASVNQVCLAAVTATVRAWHPQDWISPGRELRATLATNVRAPHEPHRLLGNKVGIASVPLPCGEHSPLRHIDVMKEKASFARLADLSRRQRVLFQKLPYWCGNLALNRSIDPRYTPLTLADVRIRRPLEFGGTPVHAVYLLPVFVPGRPLYIAWTTHRKQLSTTFLTDVAVPDRQRLPRLWHEAIDALEDAVRDESQGAHAPGTP
jgi:diacylglycerol O-acyltransferase / wax synthase